MDKETKKKWIKALRSGEYEQNYGYLRTHNGFCCLGVLADVALDAEWVARGLSNYFDLKFKNHQKNRTYLPKSALSRATQERLARMNDEEGKSFKQIANWIEKNL